MSAMLAHSVSAGRNALTPTQPPVVVAGSLGSMDEMVGFDDTTDDDDLHEQQQEVQHHRRGENARVAVRPHHLVQQAGSDEEEEPFFPHDEDHAALDDTTRAAARFSSSPRPATVARTSTLDSERSSYSSTLLLPATAAGVELDTPPVRGAHDGMHSPVGATPPAAVPVPLLPTPSMHIPFMGPGFGAGGMGISQTIAASVGAVAYGGTSTLGRASTFSSGRSGGGAASAGGGGISGAMQIGSLSSRPLAIPTSRSMGPSMGGMGPSTYHPGAMIPSMDDFVPPHKIVDASFGDRHQVGGSHRPRRVCPL